MASKVLILAVFLGLVQSAGLAQAEELGTFKDWKAFKSEDQGKAVCFITSEPTQVDQAMASEATGRVRASVTNRPADKTFGIIVFEIGFPVSADTIAELLIEGSKYYMAGDPGGFLWAPSDRMPQLIEAMKKGKEVIISFPNKNGATLGHSYSLSGFTKALETINLACPAS